MTVYVIIYSNRLLLSILQIMQPRHTDECDHIASLVLPGHAVAACYHQFYLNANALNFAMLDNLVNFTGKVRMSLR